MIKGVDISTIQGVINFPALKASGVDFCIIRAGVGNNGIDANYAKNVAGARAADIKVMAYHFVFPLPPEASQPLRDPILQAQYHFNAVGAGILACMDWEWPEPQNFARWGCTASQINTWALSYLQEYERLSGQKMIIYTYPYFAQSLNLPAAFAQYQLWIASWEPAPTIPKPWTTYVIWQNTGGGGRIPMTGVAVDTDLVRDLSLWDTLPASPVVEPLPVHQPDPLPMPPVPVPVITPPATQSKSGFFAYIWQAFMDFFKEEPI